MSPSYRHIDGFHDDIEHILGKMWFSIRVSPFPDGTTNLLFEPTLLLYLNNFLHLFSFHISSALFILKLGEESFVTLFVCWADDPRRLWSVGHFNVKNNK